MKNLCKYRTGTFDERADVTALPHCRYRTEARQSQDMDSRCQTSASPQDEEEEYDMIKKQMKDSLGRAVYQRDLDKVTEFFENENAEMIANEREFQLIVLSYAIQNNLFEILELLLKNKFYVGTSSLFAATRAGIKECVSVILRHTNCDYGDVDPETIPSGYFISPLMLAIQLEQYDIIKLFVKEGYRVKTKNFVTDANEESGFESSLRQIHYYSAVADPLYISFTYLYDDNPDHPLLQIFKLNKELLQKGERDFEFKRKYQDLSKNLEKFVFDLLEVCHRGEEIRALTDVDIEKVSKKKQYIEVDGDAKEFSFLNFAIRRDNVELVAHPYSQLRLNELLYRDIYTLFPWEPRDWRKRSFLSKVGYPLRHTLLLPFLTLMVLFFPNSKLCKSMKSPFNKFHSHTGSLCIFVALLMLSSIQDSFNNNIVNPTALDWLILAWVMGLVYQEAKDFYNQGSSRYINQWWNIISIFMLVLFVASYILRVIAYGISVEQSGASDSSFFDLTPSAWYQMTLISNAMFSFAMVLSFVHLSSAFQVNRNFGPMQLSLYKILVDVLKFMVFVFTLFVAFGFSLRRLYSHFISTQNHLHKVLLSGKYNGTKTPETQHAFSNVFHSLYSLFWSLFGLTDLRNFATNDVDYRITTRAGELLFGLFQILMVIIAINMLIAMMSRSYQSVANDTDSQWKMSRTKMWMNWVDQGNVIPPPFNLLEAVIVILQSTCPGLDWIKKCISCCYCKICNYSPPNTGLESVELQGDQNIEQDTNNDNDFQQRKLLQKIMERYLHKFKSSNARESKGRHQGVIRILENMQRDLRDGQVEMKTNIKKIEEISQENMRNIETIKNLLQSSKITNTEELVEIEDISS